MARIVLCFWSDGVGCFMRARVNMQGSGITGQTSQDFIADTDWRHNEKSVYKKGCNLIDKSKLACRITGRRS